MDRPSLTDLYNEAKGMAEDAVQADNSNQPDVASMLYTEVAQVS